MSFWDTLGNWWDEQKLDEAQNLTKLKVNVDAAREILSELSTLADQLEDLEAEGKELKALVTESWQGNSGDAMWDQIDQWMIGQSRIVKSLRSFHKNGNQRLDELVEADAALAHMIGNS